MRWLYFSIAGCLLAPFLLLAGANYVAGRLVEERPVVVEQTAAFKVVEARATDAEQENHRLRERLACVTHENRCLWLKLWVRFFPLWPGPAEVRDDDRIPPQNLPIPLPPPPALVGPSAP